MMGYISDETADPSYDPDENIYDPPTTAPKWRGKTIAEMVKAIVTERTRRAVDDAITEITRDRIAAAVDAMIAEGWQKTTAWGEPTGPKVGIKERIGEILKEHTDRGYQNKGPLIDVIIRTAVDEALEKTFKPELDAAKVKFREQVDATVQVRLGETLKSALGRLL